MKVLAFSLGLFFCWPTGAYAASLAPFFHELEAGNISRAEALARKIAGENREMKRYLAAQVAFFQQKYAKAGKILQSISAGSPLAPKSEALAVLVQATEARTSQFQTYETDHFLLRYAPGKDELLPLYAGEALELAYQRIGEDLGNHPQGKMVIEFYPNWRDFIAVSTLTEKEVRTSGTVALCKFNRMMVTTPRALLRGYSWLDTVTHEYVHYVLNRVTQSRAPIWLHEGIAKYEEVRWRRSQGSVLSRRSQALLQRRLAANQLITFEQMHPSIAKLSSAEDAATAFAQLFYFISYLVEEKGSMKELRAILARVREGDDAKVAVAKVYGQPFSQIYASWKAWLPTLDLPRDPTARAHQVEFRKVRNAEDEMQASVQGKMGTAKIRELVRVADLLFERNRFQAALKEYTIADEALNEASPHLLQKMSFAAWQIGDQTAGLDALNRSIKMVPEYPPAWVRRGVIYLQKGKWKEAERDFLAANALNPFDPEIHHGLGRIYKKRGPQKLRAREEKVLKILSVGTSPAKGE